MSHSDPQLQAVESKPELDTLDSSSLQIVVTNATTIQFGGDGRMNRCLASATKEVLLCLWLQQHGLCSFIKGRHVSYYYYHFNCLG